MKKFREKLAKKAEQAAYKAVPIRISKFDEYAWHEAYANFLLDYICRKQDTSQ